MTGKEEKHLEFDVSNIEETPDSPTQGISKHSKDEESEVSDSEDEQQELLLKGKGSETDEEEEEESIEDEDPIADDSEEDDQPMEEEPPMDDVESSSDEDEAEQPPPSPKKKKRVRVRKSHNFNLDEEQEQIIKNLIASEESGEEGRKLVLTEGVNMSRAKARYEFLMKQVKENNGIPIKIDPQFTKLTTEDFDGVLGKWIFYIIGISKDGFRPKIYAGNVHPPSEKKKQKFFLNTTAVFNSSLRESGFTFTKGPIQGKKHVVMFCKPFEKGEDSPPKWMSINNMFLGQLKRKNSSKDEPKKRKKSEDEPNSKRRKSSGKKTQMESTHEDADVGKKLRMTIPENVARDATLTMLKYSLIHECMNTDEANAKRVLKFFKQKKAQDEKAASEKNVVVTDSESDDSDSSSE